MPRYSVYVRQTLTQRYRVDVQGAKGLRAAIAAARVLAREAAPEHCLDLEMEESQGEIFGVEQFSRAAGAEPVRSWDFDGLSAVVGAPINSLKGS